MMATKNLSNNLFKLVSLLIVPILIPITDAQAYPRMIPIAALFRNVEEAELQSAFRQALYAHNTNNASQLLFTIDETERVMKSDLYDVWEVTQMICTVAKRGYFYLMGSGDDQARDAYSSVSKKLNMPFINWALPPNEELNEFEVTIKPSLTKIVADIVVEKGWKNITYICDNQQGLNNLESLSRYLTDRGHVFVTNLKRLPDTTDVEKLKEFFYNFHDSQELKNNHVILDVSTGRKLNLTLIALKDVAVKSRRFHYLIASLEIVPEDIIDFRSGVLNVTGFQIINREAAFWRFMQKWRHVESHAQPSIGSDKITIDVALAYDSISVAVNAITKLLQDHSGLFNYTFKRDEMWNRGYPGVYCYPSEDKIHPNRPFFPLENGPLLAKYLRESVTAGLTGNIEFNEKGFRKNYKLKVFELLYFDDDATHIAELHYTWMEGIGVVNNTKTVTRSWAREITSKHEDDRPLIITTVLTSPFADYKKDADKREGNDRFEGYCVDLMYLIAQNLSRKFIIQVVKDEKYGNVGQNGEWNGMVGELLRDEADMAVAPLTINRQRERVVDFSKPFMTTGISIMIKKPEKQEFSVFSFLEPLAGDVWMYIIFAYIGVSLMIFLVARFSPYEWRIEESANSNNVTVSNDFSLYNCLWFTLAAFMQQGTDILPRSVSGRIASSAWWFFTMIIVSSYTANLAAFLTLEKMHAPIKSAEDLAKQDKIKYGIQEAGSTATFFKESTVPIYQQMWNYMSKEKSVLVKDYAAGIEKVRASKGRYAFLLEATANEFANTRRPCSTMKVGDNLNTLGYGVGTKFGSPLRSRVNLVILELLERGELKKLEMRWWYEKSQCDQGMAAIDSQSASLTLSKTAGIFYILIGGMVLSMAVALGEFVYRSRMDARKHNRMIQTTLSIPYRKEKEKNPGECEKINDFGHRRD